MDPSNLTSLQTIENLYQEFKNHPESVSPYWQSFFKGMDFANVELSGEGESDAKVVLLIDAYRKYGHLITHINPIDPVEKKTPEQLEIKNFLLDESDLDQPYLTFGLLENERAPLREILQKLETLYGSRIGFEFMHIESEEIRDYIQSQIEPNLQIDISIEDKKLIMEKLNQAELFESFLNMKYVGQTRFSLEGGETFIPLMAFLLEKGGDESGVEECVIGIAHRGRMNLLANIFQKSYALIFHEFEAHYLPLAMEGTSDVKYHRGFSADFETRQKNKVHLHMAANPSHLESVNPIVLGQVKAKQVLKKDQKQSKIVPILVHGDAALASQGVVYETLSMMHLDGYSVGGTIHIVINNQIGFTTLPIEGRSTRYATDVAKAYNCPIFHVNAEDPESCIFAAKLALEIRQKFHTDVFIDLNCYRKYGHNEGDEPFFTQPLEYQIIKSKSTPREIYRDELLSQGVLEKEIAETYEKEFKQKLHENFEKKTQYEKEPPKPEEVFGSTWEEYLKGDEGKECKTCVEESVLFDIAEKSAKWPENFNIHPKLTKWVEDRKNKLHNREKPLIDWALAEHLAFGCLLVQEVPVRLSGQDSRRGTFNQRHEIFVDQKSAASYFPLQHLKEGQADFFVYNSPLSEFAVMGFEYGYSLSNPKTLNLWEAQYGDFVNGAQIILDQYLTTGEMKWNRKSALTLLLPHGQEGAGPEHSSARIERFLQLAGHDNIQVTYPSTPAQFFHLLRRQALRKTKKPLIVFTPKSLLRHPLCTSKLSDFTTGSFEPILADPEKPKAKKLLLCTGKIYYDLLQKRENKDIALVRIEELYPLNHDKLKEICLNREAVWVQEEPKNMGAWNYLVPHFAKVFGKIPEYIGRERSASPASGSHRMFREEQDRIIAEALK